MSGRIPPFAGTVYRAHNPRWSFAPTSGTGAAKHGGRFNRPGVATLYTSSTYELAVTEAHQGFPFKLQPLTIVSYVVDHDGLLDLSSEQARRRARIELDVLACPWERIVSDSGVPPSWALADDLIAQGVGGLIAPSFATGAPTDGVNIVFWDWQCEPPRQVCVVDDENRLPTNDASWRGGV